MHLQAYFATENPMFRTKRTHTCRDVNGVRAMRSFTSDTCPTCGRAKAERQTVCPICLEKMNPDARGALAYARHSIEDQREALKIARDALDARTFIDPPIRVPCQRLSVNAQVFTRARLSESRQSALCPACGGPKLPGKRLCPVCVVVLRAAFYSDRAGTDVNDARLAAEFEVWLDRMRQPYPFGEPDACRIFHKSFVLMDQKQFILPIEG